GAVLFPRLNTGQRDALTGTPGMVVYNTDADKFQGFVTTYASAVGTQYDGPLGAYAVQMGCVIGGGALQAAGQSFRVTSTGKLKSLTLYNLNYYNLTDPSISIPRVVHIKILDGLPTDPSAAVLASTDLDLYPSTSGARVLTFDDVPVLQAGTDYSFVIEPDASAWDGTVWECSPSGTVPLNDATLYPDGDSYYASYNYLGSPSYSLLSGPQQTSDFRFSVDLDVGTEEWIDLH
ncbi:MAG: hypothetical protein KDC02_21555, partial [Flavobacteriales bacterium]|nr:hypothetical protein [Flavobacteriales bacterium]